MTNLELFPGFPGNSGNYGNPRNPGNPSSNRPYRQQDDGDTQNVVVGRAKKGYICNYPITCLNLESNFIDNFGN